MSPRHTLIAAGIFLVLLWAPGPAAWAADNPPRTLDDLLREVAQGYLKEREEDTARLREFEQQKERRAALLAEAKAEVARLEKNAQALEQEFEQNERLLTEAETTLKARLGNMGELFGVIRQVAGDTRAQLRNSIISSQLPDRDAALAPLSEADALPSVSQLEKLWFILQQEMTEAGRIVRYPARVVAGDGVERESSVVRVGTFNLVQGGNYVRWMPEVNQIQQLGRQPAELLHQTAAVLERTPREQLALFALDPSRGTILDMLIAAPTLEEHIGYGGIIGYLTIGLGLFAALVGLLKLLGLLFVNLTIRLQLRRAEPRRGNPLGRILLIPKNHPDLAPEDLERRIDEVIMRETARLDRWMWIIKVISVAAPLLGLLGTVTGMIRTFQAITLFGTGDPKLMAGGISEALVTTEIGLMVAIPLVLLFALLNNLARRLTDLLEEQSVGLIAQRTEDTLRQQAASPGLPVPPTPAEAAHVA